MIHQTVRISIEDRQTLANFIYGEIVDFGESDKMILSYI